MAGRVIQDYFAGGNPRLLPAAPTVAQPAAAPRPPGPPPTKFGPGARAAQLKAATRPPGPPAPAFAGPATVAQRHTASNAFPVDPTRLGLASGRGRRLPDQLRTRMEAALGADFSAVRIHVGPQPQRLDAIAFTAGSDIYFAPGQYQPGTAAGRRLLGHELAHVLQQRQGRVRNPLGDQMAVVNDRALEVEADRFGLFAATLWSRAVSKKRMSESKVPARDNFHTIQRTIWVRNSTVFLNLDTKKVVLVLNGVQKAHYDRMLGAGWKIGRLGTPGAYEPGNPVTTTSSSSTTPTTTTTTIATTTPTTTTANITAPTTDPGGALYFNDITAKSGPKIESVVAEVEVYICPRPQQSDPPIGQFFTSIARKIVSPDNLDDPAPCNNKDLYYAAGKCSCGATLVKEEGRAELADLAMVAGSFSDVTRIQRAPETSPATLWPQEVKGYFKRLTTNNQPIDYMGKVLLYLTTGAFGVNPRTTEEYLDFEARSQLVGYDRVTKKREVTYEIRSGLIPAVRRAAGTEDGDLIERSLQDKQAQEIATLIGASIDLRQMKFFLGPLATSGDKLERLARLKAVWLKLLQPLMRYNGQLAYIENQSWFKSGKFGVLIDINYYPDRGYTDRALLMHKDTQGQNLFVNLVFNNSNPMPATEWTLDLQLPTKYKASHLKALMPRTVRREIDKARGLINKHAEHVTGTKTIEGGVAREFAFVSWVDELIWHATPFVGSRTIFYTCPDHNNIVQDKPGICRDCGKDLVAKVWVCPKCKSKDFYYVRGTCAVCSTEFVEAWFANLDRLKEGEVIAEDKGDKYGPRIKGGYSEETNVGGRPRANSDKSIIPALKTAQSDNPKRSFVRSWVRVVPRTSEKLKKKRPDEIDLDKGANV